MQRSHNNSVGSEPVNSDRSEKFVDCLKYHKRYRSGCYNSRKSHQAVLFDKEPPLPYSTDTSRNLPSVFIPLDCVPTTQFSEKLTHQYRMPLRYDFIKHSTHPNLRAERVVAEFQAIAFLRGLAAKHGRPSIVIDVGGSHARHVNMSRYQGRNCVHSLKPVLSDSDYIRNESLARTRAADILQRPTWCTCTLDEFNVHVTAARLYLLQNGNMNGFARTCDHCTQIASAVATGQLHVFFLFVHSIYYVQPNHMDDALMYAARCVSVHHEFKPGDHSIDVAQYSMGPITSRDGEWLGDGVSMLVPGDEVYTHPVPYSWHEGVALSEGRSVGSVLNTGVTMVTTQFMRRGTVTGADVKPLPRYPRPLPRLLADLSKDADAARRSRELDCVRVEMRKHMLVHKYSDNVGDKARNRALSLIDREGYDVTPVEVSNLFFEILDELSRVAPVWEAKMAALRPALIGVNQVFSVAPPQNVAENYQARGKSFLSALKMKDWMKDKFGVNINMDNARQYTTAFGDNIRFYCHLWFAYVVFLLATMAGLFQFTGFYLWTYPSIIMASTGLLWFRYYVNHLRKRLTVGVYAIGDTLHMDVIRAALYFLVYTLVAYWCPRLTALGLVLWLGSRLAWVSTPKLMRARDFLPWLLLCQPVSALSPTGVAFFVSFSVTSAMFMGVVQLIAYHTQLVKRVGKQYLGKFRPVQHLVIEEECMASTPLAPIAEDAKFIESVHERCWHCKPGLWLYGLTTPYHQPRIASSCACNEVVACRNRAIFALPEPNPSCVGSFDAFVDGHMVEFFGVPCNSDRLSDAAWLDRYKGGRREQVEKGWKDVFEGYTGPNYWRKYGRTKAFIKREAILKTTEHYDPRFIQGRHDQFNACWGPLIKSFAKTIGKLWCLDGHFPSLTYMDGFTRDQTGAWFDRAVSEITEFGNPVFCEDDYKRYDRTIRGHLLDVEFRVLKYCFNLTKLETRTLEDVSMTRGWTRHGHYYEVPATRKSGDQDTSIGNTVLTGLKHYWLYCQAEQKLGYRGPSRMRAIVLGDDILIVTVKEVANAMKDCLWMLKGLGVNPKFKIKSQATAEFCSGNFVPAAKGTILTSKIGRVLTKTFWSTTELGPDKAKGYVRGICLGLINDFRHVPFMHRILIRLIYLTEGYEVWEERSTWAKMHVAENSLPSEETWTWLFERYGITKEESEEFSEWFDSNVHTICGIIEHPLIQKVVEIDLDDDMYGERAFISNYCNPAY